MELFKMGDNYLVDLNKEWISTIKEFRELLKRDKDRAKKQAQREFTFIYHYLDFRSQFREYPEDARLKESLRNADLPEDLKIEKDQDLLAAVNRYKELRETRTLKVIKGAYKATDSLAEYFNTVEIKEPDVAKNLMSSLGGIGKLLSSLKELEEQVKRELSEDAGIRGDKQKGITEDPN